MAQDILLDENGDLAIVNGDFVLGNSVDQEVEAVLTCNKGDVKEDPIFGSDLITLIKSNISEVEVKQTIKIQLKRDGKSYQELKERINLRKE